MTSWHPPESLPPRAEWLTASGIRCLLCGRWYRSLSRHLATTHDMRTDEYRERFGISRSTGLTCLSVRDQARERSRKLWEDNERVRQGLTTGAREKATPAARQRPRASTVQAMRETQQARAEARLRQRLDAAGWASLDEGVEWARSVGAGWAAVARRLGGMSITQLKERGEREGLTLPSYRTRRSPYEDAQHAQAREGKA